MSPGMDRLAALRTDGIPAPGHVIRTREEFTGPECPEVVLAFDQSFSATGWALIRFGTGKIQIMLTGTIKTSSVLTGAEEDLDRAVQLSTAVKDIFVSREGHAMTKIVFETPPKGGHVKNPEVSLMSALSLILTFRLAAPNYPILRAVSAKTWKKMASGNANLKDKRVAHDAVAQWDCVEGFEKATNESQRDAVMVGLASEWKGA